VAHLGRGTGGSIDEGGLLRQLVLRSGAMEHARSKGRFTGPERRLGAQSARRRPCGGPRSVTSLGFTTARLESPVTANRAQHLLAVPRTTRESWPAAGRPRTAGVCRQVRAPPRSSSLATGRWEARTSYYPGVTPHRIHDLEAWPIFPGAYRGQIQPNLELPLPGRRGHDVPGRRWR
jgi:hypothetical protein